MDEYIKHMSKAYMRFSKKFNNRLKPAIVALAKAIAKGVIDISDESVLLSKKAYSDLCLRASKGNKAERIVHCKGCKYSHRLPEALTCRRLTNWYQVKDDDYCSYGERKE